MLILINKTNVDSPSPKVYTVHHNKMLHFPYKKNRGPIHRLKKLHSFCEYKNGHKINILHKKGKNDFVKFVLM